MGSRNPRIFLGVAIVLISVLSAVGPLKGIGLAVLLCLVCLSLSFFLWPQYYLMTFGLFVLFQDLIVRNCESQGEKIVEAVKNLDEVIILWTFLLILFSCLSRRRLPSHASLAIPILGLVMVGVLSSIVSKVPPLIAASQLLLLLKGFLCFFILANLHIDEIQLKRYLYFFSVIACIILALGVMDFSSPARFRFVMGHGPYIEWRAGMPSVKSIFAHEGDFGWFMAFIALYFAAFFLVLGKLRYLVFGLLFSIAGLLSMRRKPLIGMVIGLLSGLHRQPLVKKIRFGVTFGLIGAILFVTFMPKINYLYEEMVVVYLKNTQVPARNALYLKSIVIAKDCFPLGAGLGRYGSWMSRVHYSPLYKKYGISSIEGLTPDRPQFINDTFWPMILGELGIIGFLCYLWIFGWLLAFIRRAQRTLNSHFSQAFALGTFMVLIEALVESLASPVFVKGPKVYFLFAAIGILFSLVTDRKGTDEDNEPPEMTKR